MPTPKFFRADENSDLVDTNSPTPDEWFGRGRNKYKEDSALGEGLDDSVKFRNNENNLDSLVYVLESAAEVFEAGGHHDLAAEVENILSLEE